MARRKRVVSCNIWPVTSTGFMALPKGGMICKSSSLVVPSSSGNTSPWSSAWSAIRMPAPPEAVTTARPLPVGIFPGTKARAISTKSDRSLAIRTPVWRKRAA